jgi:hypothetical protein
LKDNTTATVTATAIATMFTMAMVRMCMMATATRLSCGEEGNSKGSTDNGQAIKRVRVAR